MQSSTDGVLTVGAESDHDSIPVVAISQCATRRCGRPLATRRMPVLSHEGIVLDRRGAPGRAHLAMR